MRKFTSKLPGLTVYIDTPLLFDKALNRFKRKVKLSNILEDLKKHSYYLKSSIKKRKKDKLGKLKAYYKRLLQLSKLKSIN